MKKTISYRLFSIGGISKKLRPVLEKEGMLVCDEGIRGWFVTKNFKAPGKRFWCRQEGFSGFLAITEKRIIAYAYWKLIINLPFDDAKLSAINAELINPNRIDLSFESSVFHHDRQGIITVRFYTEKAQKFYDTLLDTTRKTAQQSAYT